MEKITAIRYYKNPGEFVVTTKDPAGKTSKTHANHLTDDEKAWAKNSRYFFDSDACACWIN
jgi:hypothetical protein